MPHRNSRSQIPVQEPAFSHGCHPVIDLCLSVFPWAHYRQRKGAIKLRYLYDHRGSLPAFMVVTDAKHHEVRVARSHEKLDFHLLPGSIISFDWAYIDYEWLYSLYQRRVWFVLARNPTSSTGLSDSISPYGTNR